MLRPAGRIIATLLLIAQAVAWIGIATQAEGSGVTAGWVIGIAAAAAAVTAALAFADAARRLGRIEATEA
jgi:hypothetical protein